VGNAGVAITNVAIGVTRRSQHLLSKNHPIVMPAFAILGYC